MPAPPSPTSTAAPALAARRPAALDRTLVFVTGAPRSGTSLVTKVLDAHPDLAILMENILGNRRRHGLRESCWDSPERLTARAAQAYAHLREPVVGNKVCTPDVWSGGDIARFCRLFADFRLVFVVRDPVAVACSRLRREDHAAEYTPTGRARLLLDFRSQLHTYASSWRQSIEVFWRLRDAFPEQVTVLYYEDFCADLPGQLAPLCRFLGLAVHADLLRWYELPHHDAQGELRRDLKYPDGEVRCPATPPAPPGLEVALASAWPHRTLWLARRL